MKRFHPSECIPANFFNSMIEYDLGQDYTYLGKENLAYLARFWDNRIKRFRDMLKAESDPDKKGNIRRELRECGAKLDYLKNLISCSESKPAFFRKPVISIGTKVVCFAADPDRYIIGTIVKIDRDEESGIGSLTIRTFDKNLCAKSYDIVYAPDGFSMFLAEDFDYYRAHPDYFRLTLEYLARPANPAEIDYVNRLVNALRQSTMPNSSSTA